MSTYEALKYAFTGANITGIPTSAVTSGTFADARISSGSVTQHVTAVTQATGTWTPTLSVGNNSVQSVEWARYWRVGNHCTAICYMDYSSQDSGTDSSSDQLQVGGLPITAANTGNYAGIGMMSQGIMTFGIASVVGNANYAQITRPTGDTEDWFHSSGDRWTRNMASQYGYTTTAVRGYWGFSVTYQV